MRSFLQHLIFFQVVLFAVPSLGSVCTDPQGFPADTVAKLVAPNSTDTLADSSFNLALANCPEKLVGAGSTDEQRSKFREFLTSKLKEQAREITKKATYKNIDSEVGLLYSRTYDVGLGTDIFQDPALDLEKTRTKARADAVKRAEMCSTKNNLNEGLGNIRNQGDIGWCYAYTVADLLSHKLNKTISAVDVAFIQNAKNYEERRRYELDALHRESGIISNVYETAYEGGHLKEAIERVKNVGACLESKVPSRTNENQSHKEVLNLIHRTKMRLQEFGDSNQAACLGEFASQSFPGVERWTANEIAIQSNHSNLMTNLSNQACGTRENINHLNFEHLSVPPKSRDDQMAAIDEQLRNGNIVGVTYFSKMIDPQVRLTHASSIVGRRFNQSTGECEYMLRNSWGPERRPSVVVAQDNGYLWIPTTKLRENLVLVDYIK